MLDNAQMQKLTKTQFNQYRLKPILLEFNLRTIDDLNESIINNIHSKPFLNTYLFNGFTKK